MAEDTPWQITITCPKGHASTIQAPPNPVPYQISIPTVCLRCAGKVVRLAERRKR